MSPRAKAQPRRRPSRAALEAELRRELLRQAVIQLKLANTNGMALDEREPFKMTSEPGMLSVTFTVVMDARKNRNAASGAR